jgi:hypothetical protein
MIGALVRKETSLTRMRFSATHQTEAASNKHSGVSEAQGSAQT